ncbi:type II toxin-antitoxin system RelE/ParE family toxin [Bacteroides sp.]
MGTLKVVWRKKAILRFDQIVNWYANELGSGAASKCVHCINDTVNTLSHSPEIGILDEEFSTRKIKYYSFLFHPKYRLVYHFNKTTLYISAIRATMMKRGS